MRPTSIMELGVRVDTLLLVSARPSLLFLKISLIMLFIIVMALLIL